MTRHDRIDAALSRLQEPRRGGSPGRVTDWYCYSPGDGWTRWVVWGPDLAKPSVIFTTREVEAFIAEASRKEALR